MLVQVVGRRGHPEARQQIDESRHLVSLIRLCSNPSWVDSRVKLVLERAEIPDGRTRRA
jgi:hypothetical protein